MRKAAMQAFFAIVMNMVPRPLLLLLFVIIAADVAGKQPLLLNAGASRHVTLCNV
jgi:hypothetical protein